MNSSTVSAKTAPNEAEILTVGSILLCYGLVGFALYAFVGRAMYKQLRQITGYRYLLSQGVGDLLLLLQFAVWPGLLILRREDFFPASLRWHLHIYFDYTWWVVAYHYGIVAWSRMAAVRNPVVFKNQRLATSAKICLAPWLIGWLQTVVSHLHPDFAIMYIEPAAYGFVFDNYTLYSEGGTENYYLAFNVPFNMIVPFAFYAAAIFYFWRSKRQKTTSVKQSVKQQSTRTNAAGGGGGETKKELLTAEVRLLVPCMVNNAFYVAGQYAINNNAKFVDARWIAWFVLMIFTTKSVCNPILYILFSKAIRRQLFGGKTRAATVKPRSDPT